MIEYRMTMVVDCPKPPTDEQFDTILRHLKGTAVYDEVENVLRLMWRASSDSFTSLTTSAATGALLILKEALLRPIEVLYFLIEDPTRTDAL